MGLLRVLLAISVVLVHSKNNAFFFVDGQSAVEAFYAVSCFYMALILNEKYKDRPNANMLFWRNRFLRIFPLYWTVAGLTLASGFILFALTKGRSALPFHEYLRDVSAGHSAFNPLVVLYVLFSNVAIIGQEIGLFLRMDPLTGVVSYNAGLKAPEGFAPIWRYMLIIPAWTLSIELMFYLLAPFLVRARRWKWMVAVFAFSCAVRLALWKLGLTMDPWRYMFFPAELIFFLGGSALYFSKNWGLAPHRFQSLVFPITAAVLALTVFFNVLPLAKDFKAPLYVACVVLSLPALFAFSSRFKWDRTIGELSYPVYISHMLVMHCFEASFVPQVLQNAFVSVAGSLALAVVLNKAVALPIERKRQKPFARSQAAPREGMPGGEIPSSASQERGASVSPQS